MMLFGRPAWWFPRRLERATPRVDLEGTALRRPPVAPAGIGDIPDVPAADVPVGRKSQLHTAGRDGGQM
jgi:hypothetical protein